MREVVRSYMGIPPKILVFAVIANLMWSCTGSHSNNNKDVELSRKETELSKKEAELAKRELEIYKSTQTSSPKSDPSPDPKVSPAASSGVSGFWVVRYNSGGFNGRLDLRLKQRGERLFVTSKSYVGGNSGIWKTEPGGKVTGNAIAFYLEEKGERATYTGIVAGDSMKGTMSFGGTWTAKRQ